MWEIEHGSANSGTRPATEGLRGQLVMPWATTEEPYEVMRQMYVMGGTGE